MASNGTILVSTSDSVMARPFPTDGPCVRIKPYANLWLLTQTDRP